MNDPICLDMPGKRVLLTGNEAIARGALEAGVRVTSSYPGTPSSEIQASLIKLAKAYGFHAEWAANEKVAFETALGAAYSGLNSLTAMKCVGLNVTMDPLMAANHTGVKGGMVLVVADDPSSLSSSNEQDTRILAKFAELPVLEPSTPQEAKDMVKTAFDLSRELELIVIIRSVTRLSHSRGDVVLGEINQVKPKASFEKNLRRWVLLPEWSHKRHKWLHEQFPKIEKLTATLPFNTLNIPKNAKLGIIAGGLSYIYAKEALQQLNLTEEVAMLKVGVPYPLPSRMVKRFLGSVDKVLVVEEVEPFLEEQIRAITYELDTKPEILGKLTTDLPREWEFNVDILTNCIAKINGMKFRSPLQRTEKINRQLNDVIIPRPLTLCPGCPHRASLYALKRAVKKVSKGKAVYSMDIGCYGLGAYMPLGVSDITTCMGASISIGAGMDHAELDRVKIAIIGDSTFIHSGLSALMSANWNKAKLLVVILDNRTTAMTGFQPNPGNPITGMDEATNQVDIEEIIKACNISFLRSYNSYNIKEGVDIYEEALTSDTTAVVISRQECAILSRKKNHRTGTIPPLYTVDPEKCNHCRICISQLGCPAIYDENKTTIINPVVCTGCGVCEAVCPQGAIHQGRRFINGLD